MHRGGQSWLERVAARGARSFWSGWHALGRLPIVRGVRGSQLRRLDPLAGGQQRGTPVIRHYWEKFLTSHRRDLRGRGLEVGDTSTLSRIGGAAMTACEALDLAPRSGVGVVADLSRADHVPSETYDCFVVPFTMHLIYDVESALYHAVRILKPGGTLLVNFPCVDYCFPNGLDMGTGRALFVFWWFTPLQVENLLRRIGLTGDNFQLVMGGNLFSRVAYQMNMPVEELTSVERDHRDEGHPLLISVRLVRPADWKAVRPEPRDPWIPSATPAQWNPVTGHYPRT